MIFAKMDVLIASHPKALAAGEAMATWAWALAYTRQHELDGLVPLASLSASWVPAKALEHAEHLVAVGLFEREGTGYRMSKYAEKNETKEEIGVRRAEARDRVTRYRQRSNGGTERVTNAFVPGSDSDSVSVLPEGVQGEGSPRDPAPSGVCPVAVLAEAVKPHERAYETAYTAGLERGGGGTYAFPWQQRGELHAALLAHAKARDGTTLRGERLLGWIEAAAADFARAIKPEEAKFYSSLGPKGFSRWLNEQALVGRRSTA